MHRALKLCFSGGVGCQDKDQELSLCHSSTSKESSASHEAKPEEKSELNTRPPWGMTQGQNPCLAGLGVLSSASPSTPSMAPFHSAAVGIPRVTSGVQLLCIMTVEATSGYGDNSSNNWRNNAKLKVRFQLKVSRFLTMKKPKDVL